jgi:hypothetical protein
LLIIKGGGGTMQFSLEAIQNAQMKYTRPDFPKLIREFKDPVKTEDRRVKNV